MSISQRMTDAKRGCDRTQRIANRLARNRQITREYANVFNWTRQIRWAGMAAFASKQVGCVLKRFISLPVRHVLAEGNRAVYRDIAISLKFISLSLNLYPNHEIIELLEDDPEIPIEVIDSCKLLLENDHDLLINQIECCTALLNFEQSKTLQTVVYDDWLMKLGFAGLRLVRPNDIKIVFKSSCDTDDLSYVAMMRSGKIEVFEERWRFAVEVMTKFNFLLEDPGNTGTETRLRASLNDLGR